MRASPANHNTQAGWYGTPLKHMCWINEPAKDDREAFLNSSENSAQMATWPEAQWVSILIPCLGDHPSWYCHPRSYFTKTEPEPQSISTEATGGDFWSRFPRQVNYPENQDGWVQAVSSGHAECSASYWLILLIFSPPFNPNIRAHKAGSSINKHYKT